MGLEIERRFLICAEGWRRHAGAPQALRQGYLASSEQGVTVRLRISAEKAAWLTLKAPAGGFARHEFEYPLPLEDAEALETSTISLGRAATPSATKMAGCI